MATQDPIAKLILKIVLVMIAGIFIIYVLAPILEIFSINSSTGDAFTDVILFIILPLGIMFIALLKIIRVFQA